MAGERSVTDEPEYDYVIVGGGTAGCVLAARLTEDPDCRVCVIEGGPSDVGDERILRLRNWINLLGSEFDYGSCRMGADDDPLAVLDPQLRVRGVSGVRVVDASPFPTMPTINPVLTVLLAAERAADLIKGTQQPGEAR
ncbi:GMC oxidoreductase [Streptomyces avermitilis]|uniref:GMC oxidoreductase n=1 Tax=Streptomyces avermitilis TaxID=33903 RepID=UPI00369EB0FF